MLCTSLVMGTFQQHSQAPLQWFRTLQQRAQTLHRVTVIVIEHRCTRRRTQSGMTASIVCMRYLYALAVDRSVDEGLVCMHLYLVYDLLCNTKASQKPPCRMAATRRLLHHDSLEEARDRRLP